MSISHSLCFPSWWHTISIHHCNIRQNLLKNCSVISWHWYPEIYLNNRVNKACPIDIYIVVVTYIFSKYLALRRLSTMENKKRVVAFPYLISLGYLCRHVNCLHYMDVARIVMNPICRLLHHSTKWSFKRKNKKNITNMQTAKAKTKQTKHTQQMTVSF